MSDDYEHRRRLDDSPFFFLFVLRIAFPKQINDLCSFSSLGLDESKLIVSNVDKMCIRSIDSMSTRRQVTKKNETLTDQMSRFLPFAQ
jgi:hypothetical protein